MYEQMLLHVCLSFILSNDCPQLWIILDADRNENLDTMRFPRFHTELLQQQWADPSQDLGRIKLTIAEGLRDPDTSGFERRANVVSFAFQHAPLGKFLDLPSRSASNGMQLSLRTRV